ncbi:MAG TPA: hypothetical protein VGH95_07575 [Candidatus Aquirickettsiella sp.]
MSIIGPGLVVMLADTDAGSLIAAAQSGAVWGVSIIDITVYFNTYPVYCSGINCAFRYRNGYGGMAN